VLLNVDHRDESRKSVLSPPSRRGCRAESNNGTLPQEFGATGEVKQLLKQASDLPRCAVSKVTFHFLERRTAPSSKEGIKTLLRILSLT
jgi:hypothetical protein